MATWVQGIHVLIPQGSPSFRTREALRLLRQLDLCREVLGDRARDDLEVVLSDGTKRTKLRLGLAPRQPIYGPWPRERAPGIDGEVGYLPLPRMDDDAARRVREWMPRLRDAEGLVVDVRGNGGGTREALLALHPWLAGTRVASAAKHRRAFPRDHLDARFMERVDELSGDERKAAKAFLAAFKPEWEPPKAEFGEWHVLVLPAGADRYAGKVAVLMDDRCFSATDIFLGALKGLPNVTLVGRPSGGGSGFAQRFTLPRSGITVRCASMASFTPWGELYDLHGIAPDVAVEVSPSYFLEGGDDEMLARAREVVSR
jgi:C-terminal processing protease CtpA/Prc